MYKPSKYFIASIFTIICFCLCSQNQAAKWFFGNGAGLNFSAGPNPTVVTGGAITTSLGCSGICDAAGNLLFYSDGATIYDQTHAVMANGNGLFGGNVSQPAMVLKKPGAANLYYVFTQQATGLYYSIVDMTLAAGLGSVTVKNAAVYTGTCAGKMTATKHCNGSDYWLVAICGNNLLSYSLTAAGVSSIAVTSSGAGIISFNGVSNIGNTGCMKLSPNGRKLVVMYFTYSTFYPYGPVGSFHVYNFDNSTGLLGGLNFSIGYTTGPILIAFPLPYGCEFSSNSSKLYVAPVSGVVQQYDFCAPTPSLSAFGLTSAETNTNEVAQKRSMQLGPNGKIYICSAPSGTWTNYVPTNSLSVVNNPNAPGAAANYVPFGLSLGTYTAQWGLPNFPGSYFEQKPNAFFTHTTNSTGGCLTASFSPSQVCSGSGYSVTGYQWNFGDLASGPLNTSFLSNPVHTYPTAGIYTVQLVRSFQCSTDTIRQTVTVTNPTLTLSTAPMACGSNTALATVSGGSGSYTYSWSPGSYTTSAITVTVAGGVYSVTVADNMGGCTLSNTINVPNVILSSSLITFNASCFGLSNGSAIVAASGGSGAYTYTWNVMPSGTNSVNSLGAGTHTLQIYDQLSLCQLTNTFVISAPPSLSVNIAANTSSACAGGSVVVFGNGSGGTPQYQYSWPGGPSSVVYTVSQQVPGNYVYTVNCTDANNCPPATATVNLTFYPNPTLSVSGSSLCAGNSAVLLASGANSYVWFPGSVTGATYAVSPAATTIYTVQGDSQGCVSTVTTQAVVLPLPNVTAGSNAPLCGGQTLLLNSTSNGITYFWTGPNGYSSSQPNPSITQAAQINSGVYSITVTHANSCAATTTLQVNVLPSPTLIISSNIPVLCFGQTAILTVSGASTYTWSGFGNSNTVSVAPVTNTSYYVTGAMQPSGCSSTQSINIKVSECLSLKKEEGQDVLIQIIPNPANEYAELFVSGDYEVLLINSLGVTLNSFSVTKGKNTLNVGLLPVGCYHLIFSSTNYSVGKKLVIVR